MSFSLMALITGVATLALGLGFLFAGQFMLRQWGVAFPDAAALMSRRIGAVYLGISALLLLMRMEYAATQAVSLGIALATGLLTVLGLLELRAGRVHKGILVSTVVEVLLTLGFLSAAGV